VAGVYAGIPGPLAILTMTPRGLIRRQASEGIALDAWIGLCVFAAIGGMLGWIAGRTVDAAVRAATADGLDENRP
jgi:hypothetical protein